MSPRLNRVWLLVPFLLLVGKAWALGLGDIRLSSALNQPLRAEIELLAATPEELDKLTVQLASQETFDRYDLDRPMFLTTLRFEVVESGRADGNVIRVTSAEPITEPFITFLVEASWSRGRLLREYTVLLDPPTFAPPPTTQATQAVTAPTRSAPADSGEIRRPAPAQQQPTRTPAPARPPVQPPVQAPAEPAPAPEPVVEAAPEPAPEPRTETRPEPQAEPAPEPEVRPTPEPAPQPTTDDRLGQPGFDSRPGGDVQVVRGDTLWGITQRVRPDSRLSINQTMLAIYEANPGAFDGNINRLRAGATLRIPSAEDIFRIRRQDAFNEVRRQNTEWRGEAPVVAPEPVAAPEETQPSLTLVPPDEEDLSLSDTSIDTGEPAGAEAPDDDIFVDPVEQRIAEIESILQDQDALIEIPDNELAALRQELSDLRGEPLPVDEPVADILPEEDEVAVDDEAVAVDEEIPGDDAEVAARPDRTPQVVTTPARDEGIVDTILGYLNNFWVWIGSALVITVAILVWFMRRAAKRDDEEATGVWESMEPEDADSDGLGSTERLQALARDDNESIVVVETEPVDTMGGLGETLEVPAPEEPSHQDTMELSPESVDIPSAPPAEAAPPADEQDVLAETGTNKSLEDTFSSETAINLDQGDPVAEADFHMAYGLYDQAADLINGALNAEPDREDLLAKLCEIYFVWGNRDGFVDAAQRLKTTIGGDSNAEWDKIVIMGKQIAADHEMFSGASAEGVTKAVDLSFDAGMDDAGDLDIDFASDDDDSSSSDVIDLGGDEEDDIVDLGGPADDDALDISARSDKDIVGDETGQVLIPADTGTGIDFSLDDDEPDLSASATREMASDDDGGTEDSIRTPTIEEQFEMEATGEMPAIEEEPLTQSAPTDATAEIDLDDLGLDLDSLEESAMASDEESVSFDDLEDTAAGEQLDVDDELEETGRNPALDDDLAATGLNAALDDELAETGRNEAVPDEIEDEEDDDLESTSTREVLDVEEALAATAEMPAVDSSEATGIAPALDEEAATQLASLDDDDDEYVDEDTDVGLDTSLLDATGQTQVLTEDMAVDMARDLDAALDDTDATMLAGDDEEESTLSDDAATMMASLDDDDEGDFEFAKTEALPKDAFDPDLSTDETGRMPGLAGSTDMDLDLDDLTAALKVSEVGDTVNQIRDDATVEQPRLRPGAEDDTAATGVTQALAPEDLSEDLHDARTMTEVGTKLDLARAYVDMGDPAGARSILEEVLDEGDEAQKQQARQLIDSLPA